MRIAALALVYVQSRCEGRISEKRTCSFFEAGTNGQPGARSGPAALSPAGLDFLPPACSAIHNARLHAVAFSAASFTRARARAQRDAPMRVARQRSTGQRRVRVPVRATWTAAGAVGPAGLSARRPTKVHGEHGSNEARAAADKERARPLPRPGFLRRRRISRAAGGSVPHALWKKTGTCALFAKTCDGRPRPPSKNSLASHRWSARLLLFSLGARAHFLTRRICICIKKRLKVRAGHGARLIFFNDAVGTTERTHVAGAGTPADAMVHRNSPPCTPLLFLLHAPVFTHILFALR